MLTEEQLIEKLKKDAETFCSLAKAGNYIRAKVIYDNAHRVAVTMQIDGLTMSELFGQWGGLDEDDTPPPALFRCDLVERVNYECCVRSNRSSQDIACRMAGEPVRFYNDDNFCALRCRKAGRK